ncbi:MAG: putative ABC transporter permease [Firmicutes bacterium]|nr:putative ABC transporter permease [[Eubacterium] siraeum]MCM1486767.1 putative ABC transporter permease [Bacillota bacterium]
MTKPASPALRETVKLILLFLMGGMIYFAIEVAYKGDSHCSMFITGGLCFLLIGGINSYFDRDMPLLHQMFFSAVIITLLEFISGVIVNIGLKLNVWDYSRIPFNFMGQICLRFFFIWFFLSLIGIFLDDFFRERMFGEDRISYTVFKKRSAARKTPSGAEEKLLP